MDISATGIIVSTVPYLATILTTFVLALFGLSKNSHVQDFVTELFVTCTRPVLGRPISLLKSQKQFGKDWPIFGQMWVAKYTISKPEDVANGEGEGVTVREALRRAIVSLGDAEGIGIDMPDVVDVETEWTGYRSGVSLSARRPMIPEEQQYKSMMEEVRPGAPTVLYLHGGAFCLMDPAQFRFPLSWQARRTKGRHLSVRHRLSPQNKFPSALLDAFIAYLSLISPPPNAFHEAISASQIVIAGDSSGGGLAASLLLLLLTLPKIGISYLRFHGRDVPIASPPAAGLALNSPWLDISRALPSVHRNTQYDIIAPPSLEPHLGGGTPDFPHDSIWPTSPPRVETYCIADFVTHPLVSPLAASMTHWQGSPPVYVCVGWEFGQDETEVTMRRMFEAGATVVFDGYVGMPHCFSMLLPNRAARIAFDKMAAFCTDVVIGRVKRKDTGTWTDKFDSLQHVHLEKLGMVRGNWECQQKVALDDATVHRMLTESKRWRVQIEEKLLAARRFTMTRKTC